MEDLSAFHPTNVVGGERENRERVPRSCHELHLEGALVMDMDHGADISGFEAMVGEVATEDDRRQFVHGKGLCWGYAVMRMGGSSCRTIHTVASETAFPSGA